jgi:hypothetical protein
MRCKALNLPPMMQSHLNAAERKREVNKEQMILWIQTRSPTSPSKRSTPGPLNLKAVDAAELNKRDDDDDDEGDGDVSSSHGLVTIGAAAMPVIMCGTLPNDENKDEVPSESQPEESGVG